MVENIYYIYQRFAATVPSLVYFLPILVSSWVYPNLHYRSAISDKF